MEKMKILGNEYEVMEMVETANGVVVPLVGLELMDDSTWERLARENAVHNYYNTFGHAPGSIEDAVMWQRNLVYKENALG